MECKKCKSTNIGVRVDKRGIAERYCKDCDTGQGKVSSAELVSMLLEAKPTTEQRREIPCRYCSENYFIRMGRLGTQYIPIDIEYCPMCGRKINREKDRGL